jgi:hypothetical protein
MPQLASLIRTAPMLCSYHSPCILHSQLQFVLIDSLDDFQFIEIAAPTPTEAQPC